MVLGRGPLSLQPEPKFSPEKQISWQSPNSDSIYIFIEVLLIIDKMAEADTEIKLFGKWLVYLIGGLQ